MISVNYLIGNRKDDLSLTQQSFSLIQITTFVLSVCKDSFILAILNRIYKLLQAQTYVWVSKYFSKID